MLLTYVRIMQLKIRTLYLPLADSNNEDMYTYENN